MRPRSLALFALSTLAVYGGSESQDSKDLVAYVISVPPSGRIRGSTTLKDVESAVGVKVFLSGPHRNGALDFKATREFGHYNPEFLRRVIDTLLGDGAPVERLSLFSAFHERLLSLSAARCHVQNAPEPFAEFEREYAGAIEAGERFSAYGELSKWNDFRAGYGAEDLAFWARRDWDGTFDLVSEGVRKALRRVDFSKYHARVGCLQARDPTEPTPLFFTTDSFLDHRDWGDPSALPCREELIERHAWRDPPVWRGGSLPRIELDARIEGPEQIAVLSAAGCPENLIAGPHFALLVEEGRLRWQPAELDFSLEFTHYRGCDEKKLVDLRVRVTADSGTPLLLSAGKPRSAPGFFTETREEQRGGSRAAMVPLSTDTSPGLSAVYEQVEVGPRPGSEGSEKEVVLKTTLWAEFHDGRKTKIEERQGVGGGDYGYLEPSISDVKILDVNGDGEPDFLYDVDNGGRYLVLTRGGEILSAITIVTDRYSGVGGC